MKRIVLIGVILASSFGEAERASATLDEPQPPNSPSGTDGQLPQERFLLLTNGRLLQGMISEEGADYVLTQRLGVMRLPKKGVEGIFGSVREAYAYKLEQLPERDSEERLKLARWCLAQKMTSEAKEQLARILEHNPGNAPARAMLVKIEQEAMRTALRQRDPEVKQARATRMSDDSERLAVLDSAVIGRAQSAMGIPSTPIIFDLPKPQAIKSTVEFYRFVHPLLQAYCAKCHNEQHQGPFQLVPIRARIDRTPDALRHNLDATLALVNRENLSKSELLTSTLRPHGDGRGKRPIFPGSNDRAYQVLVAWVNGLRAPRTEGDATRPESGRGGTEGAEPFAADRSRVRQEPSDRASISAGASEEAKIPPPSRFVPDLGIVVPDRDPDHPKEFPLPFVISGAKPPLPPSKEVKKEGAQSKSRSSSSSAAAAGSTSAGATASRGDKAVKPASSKRADKSSGPAAANKDDATAAKKPAKPVKLDPAALEQLLRARNQGR